MYGPNLSFWFANTFSERGWHDQHVCHTGSLIPVNFSGPASRNEIPHKLKRGVTARCHQLMPTFNVHDIICNARSSEKSSQYRPKYGGSQGEIQKMDKWGSLPLPQPWWRGWHDNPLHLRVIWYDPYGCSSLSSKRPPSWKDFRKYCELHKVGGWGMPCQTTTHLQWRRTFSSTRYAEIFPNSSWDPIPVKECGVRPQPDGMNWWRGYAFRSDSGADRNSIAFVDGNDLYYTVDRKRSVFLLEHWE